MNISHREAFLAKKPIRQSSDWSVVKDFDQDHWTDEFCDKMQILPDEDFETENVSFILSPNVFISPAVVGENINPTYYENKVYYNYNLGFIFYITKAEYRDDAKNDEENVAKILNFITGHSKEKTRIQISDII